MKHIVVQLSGKQGSGKSTVARLLRTRLEADGYAVVDHSYARVIYLMHDEILGLIARHARIEVPAKSGELLQLLGTWGRKLFGEDIWVNTVKNNVAITQSNYDAQEDSPLKGVVHLISDCRFTNEACAFSGPVYRLECPEETRKARVEATPGQNWRLNTTHESEVGLDYFLGFRMRLDSERGSSEAIASMIVHDINGFMEEK